MNKTHPWKKEGRLVRLTEWQVGMLELLVDRELENETKLANQGVHDASAYRRSLRALRNKLSNL